MKKVAIIRFIHYACFSALLKSQSAVCQEITRSPFKISFRQSTAISDESGKPKSSKTWYFPAERFIDSTLQHLVAQRKSGNRRLHKPVQYKEFTKIATRIDTFKLRWFSYYLYKLNERVLYNYPLNKEVYRLTWLRSFHPPIVVRIEKQHESIRIFTKMLSRIPELPGHYYRDSVGNNHLADTTTVIPFEINGVKAISKADFDQFLQMFINQKALFMSPLGVTDGVGADGSEWILESHRSDGYYFMVRWSPSARHSIRRLGDYLLDRSSVRYEERY